MNDDFFNESNMDNSFVEKKKAPILQIFGIIILILLLASGIYYYFVIDNPKTILKTYFNSIPSIDNINYPKYIEYSLKVNVDSNNKENEALCDLLNKLILNIKSNNNEEYNSYIFNLGYEDKVLPNIKLQTKNNENKIYLLLEDIYDKTIEIDLGNEEHKDISKIDKDDIEKEFNNIYDILKEEIKNILEKGEYSKKIEKLDKKIVRKYTINISKDTLTNTFNNLLNNKDFITSCTKITNQSEEKVTKEIKDIINDLTDIDFSIYQELINKNIIKYEITFDNEIITVLYSNNIYTITYKEDDKVIYTGTITIDENDSDTATYFNTTYIADNENIKTNIVIKTSYTSNIELLDTTNSININDISDKEMNNILNNILNNDAVKSILNNEEVSNYIKEKNA